MLQYFFMFDKALTLGKGVEHFGGRGVGRTVTNFSAIADGYGHVEGILFNLINIYRIIFYARLLFSSIYLFIFLLTFFLA